MDVAALWCNICPKQPHFSDVSHLLTHVSSKAHLAHYFKLQVRSHQEPEARDALDEYDQWYKTNNLAKLLSDRMASKEARKRRSSGKPAAQGRSSARTVQDPNPTSSIDAPQTEPSAPDLLGDFLDPRLCQPHSGTSQDMANKDCSLLDGPIATTGGSESDSQGLFWSACPPCSTTKMPTYPWKTESEDDSEQEAKPILHTTPVYSNRVGIANALPQTPPRAIISSDPFIDDKKSCDGESYTEVVDKEKADEMTRLKGVLWPGMDIFDSATEQMRRQRNQKKDGSIIKMMEKTSEGIEPTELVFSPTGILRKQRVISGNVEDSSPLKGETPIPKRRAVRVKRAPLSQSDPNTSCRIDQDKKKSKKSRRRSKQSLEELSRQALPTLDSPVATPLFDHPHGYGNSITDFHEEFELSLEGIDQKPRSGFQIFKDDDNQPKLGTNSDILGAEGKSLSPAPPHASCRPSGSVSFIPPHRLGHRNHAADKVPSTSHFSNDQENIEPVLNRHGRIDPHPDSGNIWDTPGRGEDECYPLYYSFGDSCYIDFDPFGGSDMFGYTRNPLAASRPYLQYHRDQSHVSGARTSRDSPSKIRALSSDATISDMEQEDRGRLYFDGSFA
ncbi:hypothetical protein VTN77DRAFT_3609 [Rasamsonia byssochlamydoides]|uniref:uncharacterized protein n=1 Tax=Rasamsonia byssochlamydoides TaxID=89139 RepID=UPI003743F6CF